MDPLKMYFLLNMVIFHCYVSSPEGNFNFGTISLNTQPEPKSAWKEITWRWLCPFFLLKRPTILGEDWGAKINTKTETENHEDYVVVARHYVQTITEKMMI